MESRSVSDISSIFILSFSLAYFRDIGLPPPSPGLKLKAILVTVSEQLYMCDNEDTTRKSAPVRAGFKDGPLYDISGLALSDRVKFDSLATRAVLETSIAEGLKPFGTIQWIAGDDNNSPQEWLIRNPHEIIFRGELQSASTRKAPATGPDAEGGIDWMRFTGDSGGTEVYRVSTVGGNPTRGCEPGGDYSVPYAAQYWIYDRTDKYHYTDDQRLAQLCGRSSVRRIILPMDPPPPQTDKNDNSDRPPSLLEQIIRRIQDNMPKQDNGVKPFPGGY